MKTVLVTGAGGFIGSHLAEDQLKKNRLVKAFDINLDRLSHLSSNDRCQLITGDIRSEDLLKKIVPGIDCIFHLASAHLEVSKPESYYWETNVEAVRRFLEIAQGAGVKRFVHCSSVGVFGKIKELPANENSPCAPDILYEKTKLAGEKEVLDFSKDAKIEVIVLRPAWVYGPRCPRTLKLFRTIKKGRFFMVGDGQNFRHPIYISDMVDAFELAATQGNSILGQPFIIAYSQATPLKTLVHEIARVQEAKILPFSVPLPLMIMACVVIEKIFDQLKKEPPFSTRSLKFFTESSSFDISRARNLLGFQPKISLRKGLALTNDWFMENRLL